jgi:predicted RNA-binding Zn-ribbon protein involved in translation (DUF1610 family)
MACESVAAHGGWTGFSPVQPRAGTPGSPATNSSGRSKETLVPNAPKAENEAFFRRHSLSDRKYRQRGYQDSGGGAKKEFEKPSPAVKKENTFGPRPINMPGTRTVSRCAECGALLQNLSEPVGKCPKCGFDLHACKQCEHFDPSSRFECNQPIPARISPKDKRNDCSFFSIRVMVEKETSSKGSQRPNDARAAFDNLFKD